MLDDELGMSLGEIGRPLIKPPKPKTQQEEFQDYLKTLTLPERRQYIANMRANNQPDPPKQPAADHALLPMGLRNSTNSLTPQGLQGMSMLPASEYAKYYAGMANELQGQNLGAMANSAAQAMRDENDSRVAQSREKRRLDYQLEMERMRQQTEQMKANALIQRLGNASGRRGPEDASALGYLNPAEGLYLR